MSARSTHRLMAGVFLSFAIPVAAHAEETKNKGYDPQRTAELQDLPVRLVLMNDRLKAQIVFPSAHDSTLDLDPQRYIYVPHPITVYTDKPVAPMPFATGLAIGAAGIGVALVANAVERHAAEAQIEPAYEILHAAQCDIDASSTYLDAVKSGIRSTTWGNGLAFSSHHMEGNDMLKKQLDNSGKHYEFSISYSLTPDLSTLIGYVKVEAWMPVARGSAKDTKLGWKNNIIVASDPLVLPPKTPADTEAAVAEENARFAEAYAKLGGDQALRKLKMYGAGSNPRLDREIARHEVNLRIAQAETWAPSVALTMLAKRWSADDCALLKDTVQANARELGSVLQRLFAGELPLEPEFKPHDSLAAANVNNDGGDSNEREVRAWPSGFVLAHRRGQIVPLSYVNSWYTP